MHNRLNEYQDLVGIRVLFDGVSDNTIPLIVSPDAVSFFRNSVAKAFCGVVREANWEPTHAHRHN